MGLVKSTHRQPGNSMMKNVTKPELIERMMQITGESKTSTELSLNAFVEVVQQALVEGDKVTLVGFGVFQPHHRNARPAREGRNPQTGEVIQLAETPASIVPKFVPGKPFKTLLNPV